MKMKEDHTRLPLLATGSIQGGAPAFADALVTRSAVFIAMVRAHRTLHPVEFVVSTFIILYLF